MQEKNLFMYEILHSIPPVKPVWCLRVYALSVSHTISWLWLLSAAWIASHFSLGPSIIASPLPPGTLPNYWKLCNQRINVARHRGMAALLTLLILCRFSVRVYQGETKIIPKYFPSSHVYWRRQQKHLWHTRPVLFYGFASEIWDVNHF